MVTFKEDRNDSEITKIKTKFETLQICFENKS